MIDRMITGVYLFMAFVSRFLLALACLKYLGLEA